MESEFIYTTIQLILTTMDEEKMYFTGQPQPPPSQYESYMIPGTYRIVDGKLYRIVSGCKRCQPEE